MGITYLVTGGTGHLGNTIIKMLAAKNCRIRALVMEDDPNIGIIKDLAEIFYGDIRIGSSLESFFDCPSTDDIYVIHCADIIPQSSRFDQDVWDTNVVGTKNIINYCKTFHVKRMVFVSSVRAIPDPPNGGTAREIRDFDTKSVKGMYAKTKAAASMIVMDACQEGLNASIVHPSALLGPGDYGRGPLAELITSYVHGKLPAGFKGGYDFVDVRDVAAGTLSCLEKGRQGECYILSNRYYSLKELFGIIHDISGVREVYLTIPSWMVRLSQPAVKLSSFITRTKPLYSDYSLAILNSHSVFSHAKATEELDYHPREMHETLLDMVAFIRANEISH